MLEAAEAAKKPKPEAIEAPEIKKEKEEAAAEPAVFVSQPATHTNPEKEDDEEAEFLARVRELQNSDKDELDAYTECLASNFTHPTLWSVSTQTTTMDLRRLTMPNCMNNIANDRRTRVNHKSTRCPRMRSTLPSISVLSLRIRASSFAESTGSLAALGGSPSRLVRASSSRTA